ncbi:MAG: hypothetical protein DRO10_04055 [Thermoprotei archaeon]|nr:MAG: hypothetical protein DRO10_04055 [Thermoprotei archaeon]
MIKGSATVLGIALIALILAGVVLVFSYVQTQELRSLINSQQGKLEEIAEGVKSLGSRMNSSAEQISSLQERIDELSRRLADVESKFTDFNSSLTDLKKAIEESKFPVTVIDASGNAVTIPKKPERIVSGAPSITEILFSIGAGSSVVGVDQFSNYPPEVNDLVNNGSIRIIGGYATLNIEEILSLNPDLVLLDAGLQQKYAEKLSSMGITVIVLKESSIADIFNDILLLGAVTGHMDEAVTLVNQMRSMITATYQKVIQYMNQTGSEQVKVYYEIFPDYWTIGNTSFLSDVLSIAGGINIFSNESRAYFVASPEAIISADPDIILLNYNYGYYGNAEELISKVSSRQGWGNITAVHDGRIYVFSAGVEDLMVRPGPRTAIAIAIVARVLYPEAFGITQVPNEINSTVIEGWGLSLNLG